MRGKQCTCQGIKYATWECALTGNRTHHLSMCGTRLRPTEPHHPGLILFLNIVYLTLSTSCKNQTKNPPNTCPVKSQLFPFISEIIPERFIILSSWLQSPVFQLDLLLLLTFQKYLKFTVIVERGVFILYSILIRCADCQSYIPPVLHLCNLTILAM